MCLMYRIKAFLYDLAAFLPLASWQESKQEARNGLVYVMLRGKSGGGRQLMALSHLNSRKFYMMPA